MGRLDLTACDFRPYPERFAARCGVRQVRSGVRTAMELTGPAFTIPRRLRNVSYVTAVVDDCGVTLPSRNGLHCPVCAERSRPSRRNQSPPGHSIRLRRHQNPIEMASTLTKPSSRFRLVAPTFREDATHSRGEGLSGLLDSNAQRCKKPWRQIFHRRGIPGVSDQILADLDQVANVSWPRRFEKKPLSCGR